jgi:hypothetical protein
MAQSGWDRKQWPWLVIWVGTLTIGLTLGLIIEVHRTDTIIRFNRSDSSDPFNPVALYEHESIMATRCEERGDIKGQLLHLQNAMNYVLLYDIHEEGGTDLDISEAVEKLECRKEVPLLIEIVRNRLALSWANEYYAWPALEQMFPKEKDVWQRRPRALFDWWAFRNGGEDHGCTGPSAP